MTILSTINEYNKKKKNSKKNKHIIEGNIILIYVNISDNI